MHAIWCAQPAHTDVATRRSSAAQLVARRQQTVGKRPCINIVLDMRDVCVIIGVHIRRVIIFATVHIPILHCTH